MNGAASEVRRGGAGRHRSLGAAIVGAGLMGRWHAAAVRRAGGEVRAVVDRDAAAAERLAASAGRAAEPLPELRDLLADERRRRRIDVVHVCTPVGTHTALAASALGAGLHVLVEKPLAPDLEQARALYREAERRGRMLCPVHQILFQRGIRGALARGDDLGRLCHLDFTICSAGAEGVAEVERDPVATEILPHPLSLAERFLAELCSTSLDAARWRCARTRAGEWRVWASVPQTPARPPGNKTGARRAGAAPARRERTATAAVHGGVTMSILVSLSGRPRIHELRAIGERATIHADLFHGSAWLERLPSTRTGKLARPFLAAAREVGAASTNLGVRLVRRQWAFPGLWELVRDFYAAVATGGDCPVAPAEALRVASAAGRIQEIAVAAADPEPTAGSGARPDRDRC